MKKFASSFAHAINGLKHVLKHDINFRYQWALGSALFLSLAVINFAWWQQVIFIVLGALVLALELVNTAIERLCNLHGSEIHSDKKIIKDVAAGSVTLVAATALGLYLWAVLHNSGELLWPVLSRPFLVLILAMACLGLGFASIAKKNDTVLMVVVAISVVALGLVFWFAEYGGWAVFSLIGLACQILAVGRR
jgi:diacylglycerol kinase